MQDKPKMLAVAYKKKDEEIVNMLRKLVETNDDGEDGQIVGVEDGTVAILPWKEDVWLENKKAGNRKEKTLLIDHVEGYEPLEPFIDVKFNKHGVKYGFSGRQALIIADTACLSSEEAMSAFQNDIKASVIPNKGKLPFKINQDLLFLESVLSGAAGGAGMSALSTGLGPFSIVFLLLCGGFAFKFNGDFEEVERVRKAQLMYGIIELYYNDLEKFMKE